MKRFIHINLKRSGSQRRTDRKKNDNDKLEGKLGTCQHKHTHTPNNETKRENE